MPKIKNISPIEFTLFAPNNSEATLAGSFSKWEELPMEKGEDGVFRANVDLPDGDHQYRFRIQSKSWFYEADQWVTILDPYATEVNSDQECAVIRVLNGNRIVDTYEWRNDPHPLPSNRELVIYEMHVGDFSGGEADHFQRGTYADVVEKLDYLADLGINAIELMPVKEFPGSHGWGYNPRCLMASESSFGTTEQLKGLIDECHGRGIRVIMDGVFNHSDTEAPLAQIDHDYWYHHDPKDPELSWGPEYDYERTDERLGIQPARRFIGDVVRFWIREYHIDGIRYDAARQISNFDFLGWIVSETRDVSPDKPFYNVAEYIPVDPAVCAPQGPMDGCWHESFLHVMTEALSGQANLEQIKDALDPRRVGFHNATSVVNYFGTHDHDRILHRLGERGIFGTEALGRIKLVTALLMTAIGIPMIWMGDEFGISSPKTSETNKLDWQLLGNEDNRSLHEYTRAMIRLRKNNQALTSDNLSFIHEDPENGVLAYLRWSEEAGGVVTVANLSGVHWNEYAVPGFPSAETWHESTGGLELPLSDGVAVLDLPPFTARHWVA